MDVDHYVESLELEVIRLRAGWSDAEAQIAVLRDQKETLALELGRLQAARDACEQQFQEKVARINKLDAEVERLTLADRRWADHVARLRGECDKLIAHIEQLEQR